LTMKESNKLNIAISGHRRIHNDENLRISIQNVLQKIIEEHPNSQIILYSALAEGADQLAAAEALKFPSVTLIVPLPLPENEYFKDFLSMEGKETYRNLSKQAKTVVDLPLQKEHAIAYEYLNDYLVEQCDLFIVLWDGLDGNSKEGTTAVVEKANAVGKSIYWIYCENHNGAEKIGINRQKKTGEIEFLNP